MLRFKRPALVYVGLRKNATDKMASKMLSKKLLVDPFQGLYAIEKYRSVRNLVPTTQKYLLLKSPACHNQKNNFAPSKPCKTQDRLSITTCAHGTGNDGTQ